MYLFFNIQNVFAQSGNEISNYIQKKLYDLETFRLMGGRNIQFPRKLNPTKENPDQKPSLPQTDNPDKTGSNTKKPDEGWEQISKTITRGICKDKKVRDCKFQKNTISNMNDKLNGNNNTVLLHDNQKIKDGTKSLQKGKIVPNKDKETYYVEKIRYNPRTDKFEGFGKIILPDNKALSDLPLQG